MATEDVQANSTPVPIPAQQTSRIVSRGVPAKETIWLDDVRKRREEWQYHKKVRLDLHQIVQIIFPKQHQPKYHEIALKFMHFLLERGRLEGADTGSFIAQNSFSKATFYNVILPRLKRVGMVRLLREEFNLSKEKQKYYRKIIEPSKQFSLFFRKLSEEYETILDTAEAKRPKSDSNQTV